MPGKVKGLLERLRDNEAVICAEGYLFEFERKGYLQAGCFVPEVVIEHPEQVTLLHEEFVHAGSDVVQAFTYYAHREKMRLIGREDDLEAVNRKALKLARKVADDTNTLMAGNICNTTVYAPNDKARATVKQMFKEQVTWAVEEGADFIVAETISALEEAMLSLEAIQKYGKGVPAVITLGATATGNSTEGIPLSECMRKLEEAGADVVGLNCFRGLDTILPLMVEARKVCKGPLACLPVPYKTNDKQRTFFDIPDPGLEGKYCFPDQLEQALIPRREVEPFTKALKELNVMYMGLCCGNRGMYTRCMAEALGRRPPASKYTPDMSKHISSLRDSSHSHDNDGFHKTWSQK